MVDSNILTIGPVSGIWLNRPLPASEWLATGIHKPVFKTILNVCFQKCATHQGVSGSVSGSGPVFVWIYKMPNKTQQKLYFTTIVDLEHQ